MGVVKSWASWFGKVEWRVQVRFSSMDGAFTIKLPPEAHTVIGEEVRADTLREVESAYRKASQRFTEAAVKSKKIILLYFTDDVSFADGLSFGFACEVFDHRSWPGTDANVDFMPQESSIPEELGWGSEKVWPSEAATCITLSWTQEREDFLAGLGKAFISLIEQMKGFCDSKTAFMSFMNCTKALPGWAKQNLPSEH